MKRVWLWIKSLVFVTKRVFSGGDLVRDLKVGQSDPLTGIPNRKKCLEIISYELAQAADNGAGSVTLAFVDLDNLKYVNDTDGHEAGDEMIKSFVDVFPHYFRRHGEISVFGRIGGDEFVAVTTMNPKHFSNRVEWVQENGGTPFSFGIVNKRFIKKKRLSKEEALTMAETMIKEADRRMYENKTARKAGRDFE